MGNRNCMVRRTNAQINGRMKAEIGTKIFQIVIEREIYTKERRAGLTGDNNLIMD